MKMNKIFNWIFGSIFRTLGRVIAYVIIGIIVVLLFNFNAIKKPKISNILNDIFFMRVNASEYQAYVVDWKDDNGNSLPQYYGQFRTFQTFSDYATNFVASAPIPTGTKGMLFSVNFRNVETGSTSVCTETDTQGTNDYCSEWITDSQHSVSFLAWYNNDKSFSTCYFLDDRINGIDNNYGQLRLLLYCPIPSNISPTFTGLTYYGSIAGYGTSSPSTYYVALEKTILFDIDGMANIINNQNQISQQIQSNQNQTTQDIINNQNQNNQAIINNITDSNTTQTEGEASSFFSNFSTSDNGGLSSIITAPLSAIQSLTNASCSPLVLPLPYINENLTLPCMRTIYESHFGAFMVLYDTITIGIISYWILVRIFNMVKDFKNPDHDEIEVVDL